MKGSHISSKTEYKKGDVPWSKINFKDKTYEEMYGKERSKEIRKKIGKGNKGKKLSPETIKKLKGKKPWNTGLTKETDKRLMKKAMNQKGKTFNEMFGDERAKEIANKISLSNKGKIVSKSTIEKIRKALKGKPSKVKGKTYEEMYGKERAKKMKEAKRIIRKGKSFEQIFGKEVTKIAKAKMKIARAKQVCPVKDTKIEVKIQEYLTQLKIEFYTHQYMKEIEHSYQCDILIPSMNLVIECDGNYWHNYPFGNENDIIRTQELLDASFRVLRFWGSEINNLTLQEFQYKLEQMNVLWEVK